MIDFMLTRTGDIVMSNSQRKREQRTMFFNVNNHNSMKISFYVNDDINKSLNNKKIFSFKVIDKDYGEHEIMPIKNKDALKQMIYNVIFTSKNELKLNNFFGSRMEEVKHKPIFEERTIDQAKIFLKEALVDIIPNASISIKPDYKTHPRFKQGLRVIIKDDVEELFNEIV